MKTPLGYIRQRRDNAHIRKPTTHAKLTTLPYINPQLGSPFFTDLPGEIRHLIYEFALLGYPDPTRPFTKHSYHYRPGYTHARAINTNLLLTCRRIYLEVDQLAVSQNEHLIYWPPKHGPPGHNPYLLSSSYKTSKGVRQKGLLKLGQRAAIQTVHIYAQQAWLEDWNQRWLQYCRSWSDHKDLGGLHPPRLHITIRHTDWWYFLLGQNSPLALDAKKCGRAPPGAWIGDDEPFESDSWGSRLALLKGLQTLVLELETTMDKRMELEEVVEHASRWRFPLGDVSEERILVLDQGATRRMEWTGSRRFKGLEEDAGDQSPALHLLQGRGINDARVSRTPTSRASSIAEPTREQSIAAASEKLQSMKQRLRRDPAATAEEEVLSPEDRLDYHVVTLVWRARPVPLRKSLATADDEGLREVGISGQMDIPSISAADSNPDPVGGGVATVMPAPRPGIFAHSIAHNPQRSAFPTAYG